MPKGEDDKYVYHGPTQIRLDRREVIREDGDRGGLQFVAKFSCPLDYYFRHDYITKAQHRAGNRLAFLHRSSILRERYVRMNYGEVTGSADIESMPLSIRDYLGAYKAINGEYERFVVVAVCCDDKKAGPRRPMAALRNGLNDLIIHFKSLDKKPAE
jgi:hypothetical protein